MTNTNFCISAKNVSRWGPCPESMADVITLQITDDPQSPSSVRMTECCSRRAASNSSTTVFTI